MLTSRSLSTSAPAGLPPPLRYPFEPPAVRFVTPIYHPNVDTAGRICLDVLKMPPKGGWKPSLNIPTVLTSIQQLLGEPNPDDALMHDIAAQFRDARAEFDRTAREHTRRHAVDVVMIAPPGPSPAPETVPLAPSAPSPPSAPSAPSVALVGSAMSTSAPSAPLVASAPSSLDTSMRESSQVPIVPDGLPPLFPTASASASAPSNTVASTSSTGFGASGSSSNSEGAPGPAAGKRPMVADAAVDAAGSGNRLKLAKRRIVLPPAESPAESDSLDSM